MYVTIYAMSRKIPVQDENGFREENSKNLQHVRVLRILDFFM